jgi:exosortase/archaeosortase family protein
MSDSSSPPVSAPTLREAFTGLGRWCSREPLDALLLIGVVAVLVYFFGFYTPFMNGHESTAVWTWRSWKAENDLEHGWLIFPAALFLLWYHRAELRAAPKSGSMLGLVFVLVGMALFLVAARTLQARIAIIALPLLGYGITRFLWGPQAARLVIFPCAFLLFMIPVGFLVSRTVGLQTLAAAFASKLSSLMGIGVVSDGATLRALDGSFQFVHFTQREMWKKIVIFGGSLIFALFGNLVRIFTVVIFARFIDRDMAAGIYHDYSGFIFFPIAVGAMVAFSNLLNRDWSKVMQVALAPEKSVPDAEAAPLDVAGAEQKPANPISYDY